MGLSCSGTFGMVILVTMNILFFLFGLALVIVGIVFIVDADFLSEDDVIVVLNDVEFSGSIYMGDALENLPIFTICLWAVIVLIAGIGAMGACCKNRCLLITYLVICILITMAQIVCLSLWLVLKDKVDNSMQDDLTEALAAFEGYDVTVTDTKSTGWNELFIDLECCGVKAASTVNDEFSGTAWASTRGSKKIPVSCCQSATKSNYKSHTDSSCTDSYANYNSQGCYEAVEEVIQKYDTAVIVICVILIILEIIGIICACLMCRDIKRRGELV